jgi:hypothetical protein
MIAFNAQPIADARASGFRPAEMIIVSLVGRLDELNHTVHASTQKSYDWQWAKGLDVCIFAASGVDWVTTAKAILDAKPRWLGIWDVNRLEGAEIWLHPDVRDIQKPRDQWRWTIDFIPFLSFQNKEFEGIKPCS